MKQGKDEERWDRKNEPRCEKPKNRYDEVLNVFIFNNGLICQRAGADSIVGLKDGQAIGSNCRAIQFAVPKGCVRAA